MIKRIPRLRIGVVIASVLVGAFVFSASANATQPECKAINQTKNLSYKSRAYADPLGTAIAQAEAGDTIKVIGTCHGNFAIDKDLSLAGRASEKQAATLDGNQSGSVLTISGHVTVAINNLTITHGAADAGAGILNSGTLSLTNSTVSGNTSFFGGGGYRKRRHTRADRFDGEWQPGAGGRRNS
jgi:hypothetical protein